MYEAIRSQALAKNSLRLIGTKFTESIIELDQVENSESTLVLHPEQDLEIPTNLFGLFEDFFMLKPYQIEHTGNVNYNHSQINYTYKYHNLGVTDEAVRTFLLGNEGECWRLTEYSYEEQNQQKEMFKTINFLFSSHFTGTEDPELSILVKTVNPSYYYFGICLLGKELIALGDKTYKAPVLYGFLSFFPFVNLFKDLTATIYR